MALDHQMLAHKVHLGGRLSYIRHENEKSKQSARTQVNHFKMNEMMEINWFQCGTEAPFKQIIDRHAQQLLRDREETSFCLYCIDLHN